MDLAIGILRGRSDGDTAAAAFARLRQMSQHEHFGIRINSHPSDPNGYEGLRRVHYQVHVSVIAVASGVLAEPNVDWYLVDWYLEVSSTKACVNSSDISASSRIIGLTSPSARRTSAGRFRTATG